MLAWIKHLEQTYQCAGLCSPATFFAFSDVAQGPPNLPCLTYILQEELQSNLAQFGFLNLISGLLVFVSWYAQFSLCWRMKDFKTKVHNQPHNNFTQQNLQDDSYSTVFK